MINSCSFIGIAHTKSAQIYYNVEMCKLSPSDCLALENKDKFRTLCDEGCINYNKKWSCPPYSPTFSEFTSKWSNLYVIYIRVETEQFSYIKNDYLKIKAANSIMKSRADKYLRKMANRYGSYISTGSCRLCKPCKCKKGLACAHPTEMTYSFESLGIDVSALVDIRFCYPLLWYKQHSLPQYTSVVCGLLTNELLSFECLKSEYFNYIKK